MDALVPKEPCFQFQHISSLDGVSIGSVEVPEKIQRKIAEICPGEILECTYVIWNNSSLGCPEKGKFYCMSMVPGYKILVRFSGETCCFHMSEDGSLVKKI